MKIILIGYMGAGKTTLGKVLAKQMGLRFCDLDWYIEEKSGTTISQIFKQEGEAIFRKKEQQALHEVIGTDDIVLAVGGGTPCFYDNIDFMNQQAHTVYLKATSETLKAHIKMGGAKRPLVDGKTDEELTRYIEESLKGREPYYLKAQHVLEIDTITQQEQIDQYVKEIELRAKG